MKSVQMRALTGLALAWVMAGASQAATTLTVASFPSFDEAVKAAIPFVQEGSP